MADQYSFDVVSKLDLQEVENAVHQANKEIQTRFDFKGSVSNIELDKKESKLTVHSDDDYKLKAVVEACLSKTELPADPLTIREREVLQLVAEGKTTKEIAQVLGISAKTADSHRTRMMRKLDIHETAGLVRHAIREGLIQP